MIKQNSAANIDEPRFKRAHRFACKFLLLTGQHCLPIDPLKIAGSLGIHVMTYQQVMRRQNCSLAEAIAEAGSDEGVSYYKPTANQYFIFYNTAIASPGRIRFTIMHEIGHIFLEHFTAFGLTKLTRGFSPKELIVLDQEADAFASSTLVPPVVLRTLKWDTAILIRKHCGLSQEAATYRAQHMKTICALERYYINDYESDLYRNFLPFIYQKRCMNCEAHFFDKDAAYCPICGSNKIIWGEGELIYSGFELDANGKAVVCPRCTSEEINSDHPYCKICGAYLINSCSGSYSWNENNEEFLSKRSCSAIASGNARYCVRCGGVTTFFRQNVLKPWDANNDNFSGEEIPF